MIVEWSARARADIRELYAYISKDSPHYGRRYIEKILRIAEKLVEHPQIGRKVPEADHDDIRELIFRNYRIIYRVTPDRVYVVTVLHGSRDLGRGRQRNRGKWYDGCALRHPNGDRRRPVGSHVRRDRPRVRDANNLGLITLSPACAGARFRSADNSTLRAASPAAPVCAAGDVRRRWLRAAARARCRR